MKRKIAAIGLTILMMLGVTGCMESYEEKNENMLAHMKEKYGVEFEIQHYIPRNVDCSYDVWYCNAVGDDPELDKIEVHRYYGDMAKEREYIDQYYVRMTRDEVERRATEALTGIAGEIKVYLSSLEFASEVYTDTDQLDEFLQTDRGQYAYGMMIFLLDKEKQGVKNQEIIDQMQPLLLEAGIGKSRVRIFFVKSEEYMNQISRATWKDMIYFSGEEKIYTSDYSGNIAKELKD